MLRRTLAAIAALTAVVAVSIGIQAQGSRNTHSLLAGAELSVGCQAGIIYVTPDGASRIIGCSSAATSTATITLTPGPTSTAGPSVTPSITPTPNAQWWLAGGVDPADVVGAWRSQGAASYAASLVNLSGGPNLVAPPPPEAGPTWTAQRGWQGSSHNRLQVAGGAYPQHGWSYFMKVGDSRIGSQQFMGCRNIWNQDATGMDLNNTGAFQSINAFGNGAFGGVVITGTMTLAGSRYYVDGVLRSPLLPTPNATPPPACAYQLYILTSHWGDLTGTATPGPHGGSTQTRVYALAVYSDTLTAGQVAAIATAVSGW